MRSTRRSRWTNLGLVGAGALLGVSLTCARPAPTGETAGFATSKAIGALLAAEPAFARATTESGGTTLADIAARAMISVVNISAERVMSQSGGGPMDDPMFREFFGPGGPWEGQPDPGTRSLGSGVVVNEAGVILTSAHVVDGATEVEVTLHDGRELDAKVIGTDPRTDLAVIRILGKAPADLKPLPFGDSSKIRPGDVVLAIGNPFGVGQTVTMGIVSATGRTRVGIVDYEDFIQTDAAINPGNSGGALINMKGELVGINTAILSRTGGYQGIGFATPTAMALPILRSLLESGKVVRGWLGVTIQELDRDMAQALELEPRSGIVVSDVTPGGPAARAGIERGDIIRAINGSVLRSSARFRNLIAAMQPGTEIKLQILRDGRTRHVAIKLGTLPGDEQAAGSYPGGPASLPGEPQRDENLLAGITVTDLTAQARRKLEMPRRLRGGVVVTAIEPGSRAESMGLAVGDVVLEIDKKPIRSAADFRRASRKVGDAVIVLIYRDDTTLYLAARR